MDDPMHSSSGGSDAPARVAPRAPVVAAELHVTRSNADAVIEVLQVGDAAMLGRQGSTIAGRAADRIQRALLDQADRASVELGVAKVQSQISRRHVAVTVRDDGVLLELHGSNTSYWRPVASRAPSDASPSTSASWTQVPKAAQGGILVRSASFEVALIRVVTMDPVTKSKAHTPACIVAVRVLYDTSAAPATTVAVKREWADEEEVDEAKILPPPNAGSQCPIVTKSRENPWAANRVTKRARGAPSTRPVTANDAAGDSSAPREPVHNLQPNMARMMTMHAPLAGPVNVDDEDDDERQGTDDENDEDDGQSANEEEEEEEDEDEAFWRDKDPLTYDVSSESSLLSEGTDEDEAAAPSWRNVKVEMV
ncbi:hypothetical protein GGF32_002229 [Allomyces javanicus]|nr:hypothetical protein GGF32_002229 [Allomyces javanicus]